MHADTDHIYNYIYEHDLCSKQVYIQMLSQGMIDQNQVPNSYNGELL